jgi:uncharacterized protein YdbL (DUF1318 family)
MKKKSTVSICTALLLTACVTINIYFPAAAAEKMADEIIQDIQTEPTDKKEPEVKQEPEVKAYDWQLTMLYWVDQALNVVISPAHAENVNLAIDTAAIRSLRAGMQKRFSALQPFYAQGLIGIKSDGFVVVRNAGSVPLKDRNKVKKLVAAENSDRKKLYQAIANANGHPNWFGQIKTTFAKRWVSNAQTGWWYQTNGTWQQK